MPKSKRKSTRTNRYAELANYLRELRYRRSRRDRRVKVSAE